MFKLYYAYFLLNNLYNIINSDFLKKAEIVTYYIKEQYVILHENNINSFHFS